VIAENRWVTTLIPEAPLIIEKSKLGGRKMDLIGTPQEYAEDKIPGVMTPEAREILITGLGEERFWSRTWWGPTINADKAWELLEAEEKLAQQGL